MCHITCVWVRRRAVEKPGQVSVDWRRRLVCFPWTPLSFLFTLSVFTFNNEVGFLNSFCLTKQHKMMHKAEILSLVVFNQLDHKSYTFSFLYISIYLLLPLEFFIAYIRSYSQTCFLFLRFNLANEIISASRAALRNICRTKTQNLPPQKNLGRWCEGETLTRSHAFHLFAIGKPVTRLPLLFLRALQKENHC